MLCSNLLTLACSTISLSLLLSGCNLNFTAADHTDPMVIMGHNRQLQSLYGDMTTTLSTYYSLGSSEFALFSIAAKSSSGHDREHTALPVQKLTPEAALAQALRQRGAAVCQSPNLCSFEAIKVDTAVATGEDFILVEVNAPDLKLQRLFNKNATPLGPTSVFGNRKQLLAALPMQPHQPRATKAALAAESERAMAVAHDPPIAQPAKAVSPKPAPDVASQPLPLKGATKKHAEIAAVKPPTAETMVELQQKTKAQVEPQSQVKAQPLPATSPRPIPKDIPAYKLQTAAAAANTATNTDTATTTTAFTTAPVSAVSDTANENSEQSTTGAANEDLLSANSTLLELNLAQQRLTAINLQKRYQELMEPLLPISIPNLALADHYSSRRSSVPEPNESELMSLAQVTHNATETRLEPELKPKQKLEIEAVANTVAKTATVLQEAPLLLTTHHPTNTESLSSGSDSGSGAGDAAATTATPATTKVAPLFSENSLQQALLPSLGRLQQLATTSTHHLSLWRS